MQAIRIGHGYDVHAFSPGRQLILGGVDVPCDQGLLGHSDADVLLHAAMDAILGALALGDIGAHFPDTDPMYKGADSRALLRTVREMMKERGYKCEVLSTDSHWFGVTYKEDRPGVVAKFQELVDKGVYPTPLWKK